jgi:hypothetical protein
MVRYGRPTAKLSGKPPAPGQQARIVLEDTFSSDEENDDTAMVDDMSAAAGDVDATIPELNVPEVDEAMINDDTGEEEQQADHGSGSVLEPTEQSPEHNAREVRTRVPRSPLDASTRRNPTRASRPVFFEYDTEDDEELPEMSQFDDVDDGLDEVSLTSLGSTRCEIDTDNEVLMEKHKKNFPTADKYGSLQEERQALCKLISSED